MDIEDLRAAIESHGHTVATIFNIKQARSNTPLPLFFIDLKPNENNKDIYLIRSLLYTKVTFEPPRPKDPSPNAPNANAMGIPKRTASTPRVVLNVPEVTIPYIVLVKTDRTQSNVYYVTVLTQPITKAVLFIKSYSGEHSHRSTGDRMSDDHTMPNNRVLYQRPPMPLSSAPPQSNPCLATCPHPKLLHPPNPNSPNQNCKN